MALGTAGLIFLAACGGSATASGGRDAAQYGGRQAGNASEQTAAPGASTPVAIKDFAFDPAVVTVRAGETVTWISQDGVAHTVAAQPSAFESDVLDANERYSHAFTTPGTYRYICSIHPSMHGTVIVNRG